MPLFWYLRDADDPMCCTQILQLPLYSLPVLMGTETTEKRPKRHIQLKPELRLAEPRLGRLRLLDVLFELPLRSLGG